MFNLISINHESSKRNYFAERCSTPGVPEKIFVSGQNPKENDPINYTNLNESSTSIP